MDITMKMTIYIIVGLFIVLIVLFLFSKREISTQVEINAPAEKVWKILVAFEQYPNWNPFIREISGELSVGSQLNITIYPVGGEPLNFKPTVLNSDKPYELRWLGRFIMPYIFDGEHSFILKKISEEKILFIQQENFQGVLVPFIWGRMESGTEKGFHAMNKELKEKTEYNLENMLN